MKGTNGMDGAPKPQTLLLARALYDNCPDCSEELAFHQGDILTILERDMPGSQGWWRCLLHGRQGLAPANRLQVLTEAPTDRPCPLLLRGLEDAPANSKETQPVPPALLSTPPPSPVYEQMRSWVEGPSPPAVQVYELPEPPARAGIVCETVLRSQKQAVLSIPRPAEALYDVPVQSRSLPALKKPGNQQLYDVPARPQKAGCGPPAHQPTKQSAPGASALASGRACYKTLPNPQKPEWVYDTPVRPQKADVRNAPLTSFAEEPGPRALPTQMTGFHVPPNSRARSLTPHPRGNAPVQKKLSLPEIPAYRVPGPRDTTPSGDHDRYRVPSSFLVPHVEQQNTTPNIYDTPKAMPSATQVAKEPEKAEGVSENARDPCCSCFPRQATWLCSEPDRLSVSSSNSRVSSCSSSSTDSSSSSFSDESAKELCLDLDLVRGTVTALQHKVASSVEDLMLFVSRKWRFRDFLEANIDGVRRATNHLEESLREFLGFARDVCGAAGHLTDSHLQARIRNQLQTIASSYQILLETKGTLDGCNWSLDVLVTDKVQNSPDDLERLVMVARMVPEDIKRFTSIVVANGRLLFKQSGDRDETAPPTLNAESQLEKCVRRPPRETESHQTRAPFPKQREGGLSPDLLKRNWANVCEEKLPNLEEEVKLTLEQRLAEKDFETQNASYPVPRPLGQLDPEKKVHLSEHCRLYFGALFKAIGVFHSSLSHSQPPEIFIAQSKLVIMIGQKLVDTLCKETQDRDLRNEILCSSSRLCCLLKSLALATKQAVLEHPSPAALGRLRAEAERLEQHTRQFRGALG